MNSTSRGESFPALDMQEDANGKVEISDHTGSTRLDPRILTAMREVGVTVRAKDLMKIHHSELGGGDA